VRSLSGAFESTPADSKNGAIGIFAVIFTAVANAAPRSPSPVSRSFWFRWGGLHSDCSGRARVLVACTGTDGGLVG